MQCRNFFSGHRSIFLAFSLLSLLLSVPLTAQERDVRAERVVIDDNAADGGQNTLTIQVPGSGLTANRTVVFPDSDGTLALTSNITINTDTTLIGDGSVGTPLNINLANANEWTGTQTFPATASQGDSLLLSINAATTTVDAARIGSGLTDAQVNDNLTINGGTVDATPVGATTEATGRFSTVETTTVLGAITTPGSGMTYRDNIIIAWGDVAAAGIFNDQFGNGVMIHTPGTGVYTLALPSSPAAAAVNVTLQSIGFVTVTRAGSVCTITTYDTTATPTDLDFFYVIVGRP